MICGARGWEIAVGAESCLSTASDRCQVSVAGTAAGYQQPKTGVLGLFYDCVMSAPGCLDRLLLCVASCQPCTGTCNPLAHATSDPAYQAASTSFPAQLRKDIQLTQEAQTVIQSLLPDHS